MPERLTALDAQFLHLETPSVHMHVGGLLVFDSETRPAGPLTFADVRALVRRRIHLVPRFRQKVVPVPFNAGRPVWVDDPHFDLDFHIRNSALPAPGGRRELAEACQRIASRPLDRSKPLWELYFFEGLEDGHVAIFSKVHHCMIDGMSGIDIATILLDFTVEPREIEPAPPWRPAPEPSGRALLADAVVDQITNPIRAGFDIAEQIVRAPRIALHQAQDLAGGLAELVSEGQAPGSSINHAIGPNRRFVIVDAPVGEFKEVKDALGGTVNDVVLACAAGALHRFLVDRGEQTQGRTLRAMVPVSVRADQQHGNQITNIFVNMPVGPMTEVHRLRAISAITKDLKASHQALGAAALMNLGTWAPPTLHALGARLMSRGRFINLAVSNVPGPQVPLYMDGARLALTVPLMPLAESSGLSIAVTSLSGIMGFGLTGDWDMLPDLDVVAGGLLSTLAELLKAARA
ncbi:MAG TPA: wax ester/triacylglycerol synthase family O-acyltransferase [Actinomycetota bacterium]